MKKLYLIFGLLFACVEAFPSDNIHSYSTGTWTLLILFASILIVILAYLFIHASIEYYLRDKEINKNIDTDDEEKEELNKAGSKNNKFSEELINLFMLKRKGVISEQEYHQLKTRLFKKRTA